jgi:flagellin-like protein
MITKKRGQTDVIVTVILVLIALAAVGLIGYFIMNQVRGGTSQAQSKADCLKLDFQVIRAVDKESYINIQRNDDASIKIDKLTIVADSASFNASSAAPNSTQLAVPIKIQKETGANNLAAGTKVVLNAMLPDGTVCSGIAEKTVTAI